MKRKFLAVLMVLTLLFSVMPISAFAEDYVQGQVIVVIANSGTKFSAMAKADAKKAIAEKVKAVADACDGTAKCYDNISISQNKILATITSKSKTTEQMLAICKARTDVLSVKPNKLIKITPPVSETEETSSNSKSAKSVKGPYSTAGNGSTVDDPLFSDQWALGRGHGLYATAVWNKQKGSPDVVIAIVDSGFDISHEDLADNVATLKKTGDYIKDNAKMFRVQNTYYGKAKAVYDEKGEYVETEIEGEEQAVTEEYHKKYNWLLPSRYSILPGGIQGGTNIEKDLEVTPDTNGHGSHIAGIISAVTNNGVGMAGLARGCKIAGFSVAGVVYAENNPDEYKSNIVKLEYDNAGLLTLWNEILAQIEAGLKIKVVNASYGSWEKKDDITEDSDEYLAMKSVSEKGVIICVAAGNESQDCDNPTGEEYKGKVNVPAYYKQLDPTLNMIVVGAIDQDGSYASYSNYGVDSVDIAAPGTQVYGVVPGQTFLPDGKYDEENKIFSIEEKTSTVKYQKGDGTSYATPYVAAAVALLCSEYPDKSAAEIMQLLYDSADKNHTDLVKYGDLNIAKALGVDTGSSSSGGCNAGFGAIALLFVIPIIFKKKK